MKEFKEALKEVNLILDEVLLFDLILNSIIIFLAFYLFLMMLRLNPWYSLFPTLIYFIYLLYHDIRRNKCRMVENAYSPLYERLRTAADNADIENEVANDLKEEVVSDLRHVPVSSFVRTTRISGKIFVCVLLSFIILLAAFYNVRIPEFDLSIKNKLMGLIYAEGDSSASDRSLLGVGKDKGEEREIFGDSTVAKLGDKELTLKIQRANIEVSGIDVEEPPEKEFEDAFPDEVFATASGAYEEKIAVEDQKLVREYFKKLSQEQT